MPPIETILEENRSLKEKVVSLESQVEWLKKQLFGGGKNERQDRAQMLLKLEQIQSQIKEVQTETITYQRRKGGAPRQVPEETFKNLPVKETIEIVPEEVKADPDLYERIGEERTFEVDVVPPQLYKREIVRPKYRHLLDRSRPPLVASALKRPVMGGYASAGLISWIILSKYAHHLPLFRQEQMSARWGARLPRQSMADWVAVAAEWLRPIYLKMREALLGGRYLQADETPVRCQDPDEPSGKTFEGWLWAICQPEGDVVFDWRLSRRHEEVGPLLEGFRGVLQCDGFAGYASFAKDNADVIRVGCFAHARRKFNDALTTEPVAAGFMLRLIGNLYHMEEEWNRWPLDPMERAHLRKRDFELTLRLLKKAALLLAQRVLPKSTLGKACKYLLNQWEALVAVCEHGEARMDTNLMENVTPSSELRSLLRDGDNSELAAGRTESVERWRGDQRSGISGLSVRNTHRSLMTCEPGDGLGIANNSACPSGSGMDPRIPAPNQKSGQVWYAPHAPCPRAVFTLKPSANTSAYVRRSEFSTAMDSSGRISQT